MILFVQEKNEKVISVPLYASVSIDIRAKSSDTLVFKTVSIEQAFNNIKAIIKKKYVSDFIILEQKIFKMCSYTN